MRSSPFCGTRAMDVALTSETVFPIRLGTSTAGSKNPGRQKSAPAATAPTTAISRASNFDFIGANETQFGSRLQYKAGALMLAADGSALHLLVLPDAHSRNSRMQKRSLPSTSRISAGTPTPT